MSIRKDSFFEKSSLKLEQCLKICFCLARDHGLDIIMQDCRISKPTAVDWCQFLREVSIFIYVPNFLTIFSKIAFLDK